MNYSIDMLKRAAFLDELNNILKNIEASKLVEERYGVKPYDVSGYLQKRIEEIDNQYKKK